MGFLGTLGGILGAPFTGGASLALTAADLIGSAAKGAAENRAKGRAAEAGFAQNQDTNEISRLLGQGRLELDQERFNQTLGPEQLNISNRADFTNNLTQALANSGPREQQVGGRNIISHGLNPQDFAPSQTTQDLGTLLQQRALAEAQRGPTPISAIEGLQSFTPQELPQSTGFDTFLNSAAGVGSILGGIGNIQAERAKQRRQQFVDEPVEGRMTR